MSELEELRDRVAQLESALGLRVAMPNLLGLGPVKEKIVGLLLRRDIVSREMMLDAVYAGMTEPDPKTIEVHLSGIRKIIAAHGVSIKNRYSFGWYIPSEDKLKLKSLLEAA